MNQKLLVFIPCYNCQSQINRVISQFKNFNNDYFSEILILDNNSTDQTLNHAIAGLKKLKSIAPTLKLTAAQNNYNYNLGGSHKAAFKYAIDNNFSHVVVLHGDDQGEIKDLEPILKNLLHLQHEAMLGARFMPNSTLNGYSEFRILGNKIFNILFSIALTKPIHDLGSGLNIFSHSVFARKEVFKFSDDLRFNVFLLIFLCNQFDYKFFPISWKETDQISNVKLYSQSMKTLKILLSYVFKNKIFLTSDHRDEKFSDYTFTIRFQD